ncbi:MAG: ABC-F family ATP-binding cassette domain-containing protein [Clostridiales bacterium]|nr:ABC-F family ATP-binding cassette domain-containing protein [Clostridiales bacterium]MDY5725824.1 ABC-F family ATP-binding cassette domain-containing protein [Eubacteriales bacterium]
MLISLKNVTKSFKDQVVLKNVDFSVNEHDRIGVVGVNGVGKTTLLNVIFDGEFDNDPKNGVGELYIKKDLKIGYLKQVEKLLGDNTLYREIRSSFAEVDEVAAKLDNLRNKLADLPTDSVEYKATSNQINSLMAYYDSLDGYNVETNIKKVLNGMGFADRDLSGSVRDLSGGEKTRFALAKLLCLAPDVLLLDEPTNHLDFETRQWLEGYLKSFSGAIVVVSHDRYFLDCCCDSIAEVRDKKIYRYKGGYQSFLQQRQAALDLQAKEYAKQQEEIARMEEFVRKNLAASSSTNSVGSRVKALEKMQRIEAVPPPPKDIVLNFDYDEEPTKNVLTVKNLGITVGDNKRLFENVNFEVTRGEKIAIVGTNGVGKSSFLSALFRLIPFDGVIGWGKGVKTAYMEQEGKALNKNLTVYDFVCSQLRLATQYDVRSLLARVNIVGDDVFKKLNELSGATVSKVLLAIMMTKRANVLVLDEPTNHLDFKAMEGLDKALTEYTGTIVLVSHDRYLLKKVPTKIVEITPEGFVTVNGNYDAYLKYKKDGTNVPTQSNEKAEKPVRQASDKKQQRIDRMDKNRLERELTALEEEIRQLNESLSDPSVMSDYKKIIEVTEQIETKEKSYNEKMEKWLTYD